MSNHTLAKRVLVISDHASVAKAIELSSAPNLEITKILLDAPNHSDHQLANNHFDLMILALSSYESEPIVALARTSLSRFIGQIPILVISDKFFQSDSVNRIIHMDFPFTMEQLNIQVDNILHPVVQSRK
jgi:hypothetical protein